MIDIDAVRADTPACEKVIHFNDAGASLMPDPVYRTVTDHLALEREIGGYTLAEGALRFENWESFIAGRLGLAEAARYAVNLGLPAIERRVTELGAALREGLAKIDGVTVRDLGRDRCGIVTFDSEDEDAADLAARLRRRGINISTSAAAYARLDLGARGPVLGRPGLAPLLQHPG